MLCPCPICLVPAPLETLTHGAHLHRCPNCRHRFTDPDSIENPEQYDTKYYEVTHQNWFTHPDVKLFDLVLKAIQKAGGKSVLDLGCGRGDFLHHLAKRDPTLELTGVDFSAPKASVPPKKDSAGNTDRAPITFLRGDAFVLPNTGNFDAVVSLASIEHVADVRAFAARMAALCAPSGRIIIMTIDDSGLIYQAARALRRVGYQTPFNRLYHPHHLNHFSAETLARLLRDQGLDILKHHRHSSPVAAVDFEVPAEWVRPVLRAGVATIFWAGDRLKRSYSQTVICRPL